MGLRGRKEGWWEKYGSVVLSELCPHSDTLQATFLEGTFYAQHCLMLTREGRALPRVLDWASRDGSGPSYATH